MKIIKKIVFFLMNHKLDFVLFQVVAALLFISTGYDFFAYAWVAFAVAFIAGLYLSTLMRKNITLFIKRFCMI